MMRRPKSELAQKVDGGGVAPEASDVARKKKETKRKGENVKDPRPYL